MNAPRSPLDSSDGDSSDGDGDDVLARALGALPPVPPTPSVERVRLAARAPWEHRVAVRARLRRSLTLAAGVLVMLSVGFYVVASRLDSAGSREKSPTGPDVARVGGGSTGRAPTEGAAARLTVEPGSTLWRQRSGETALVAGAGAAGDARLAAEGDEWTALGMARLLLDGRVRVDLSAETSIVLGPSLDLSLQRGQATFDLEHDASRPLVVRAGGVVITDVGTRFTVERSRVEGRDRVLVSVDEGTVLADGAEGDGLEIRAGQGLAYLDGVAAGDPWPLDARPELTLEAETEAAKAGSPVVLRVVLANPTDGWISLPEREGGNTPLWLDVTDPQGVRAPVRVTELLEGSTPVATAIPPRSRVTLRASFVRTFGSPGTYRLRAIYRLAGSAQPPASPDLLLVVR